MERVFVVCCFLPPPEDRASEDGPRLHFSGQNLPAFKNGANRIPLSLAPSTDEPEEQIEDCFASASLARNQQNKLNNTHHDEARNKLFGNDYYGQYEPKRYPIGRINVNTVSGALYLVT
jgi:hypothetical protein